MSIPSNYGCPPEYHLGISSVLWWLAFALLAYMGIKLYLNARKTDFINGKEMFKGKGIFYSGISICILLLQLSVIIPDYFFIFYTSAFLTSSSTITFYYKVWERNIDSIRKIPTNSQAIASIILLGCVFVSILLEETAGPILDYLFFVAVVFLSIAVFMYAYMIYRFISNVEEGKMKKVGQIWIVGCLMAAIATAFEVPPVVKIFPPFFIYYITPVLWIAGYIMSFYGVNRLFLQVSTYYTQTQKCAVHRGPIEKGSQIHYCPSCEMTYCHTCYTKVIQNDGCWNCGTGGKEEIISKPLEETVENNLVMDEDKHDPKLKLENKKL